VLANIFSRSAIFNIATVAPLVITCIVGFIATLQTRKLRSSLLTGTVIGVGALVYRNVLAAVGHYFGTSTIENAGIAMLVLIAVAFVGGLLAAGINLARR
jgi:hypothetical protein